MIKIDFEKKTYECPFCGCTQAYSSDCCEIFYTGYHRNWMSDRTEKDRTWDINFYFIKCNNKECNEMIVVAVKDNDHNKQWDIIPEKVCKQFPSYIPKQIRDDYE